MIAPFTTSSKRRLVTAVSGLTCALCLLFATATEGSAQLRHMPGGGGLKGGGLGGLGGLGGGCLKGGGLGGLGGLGGGGLKGGGLGGLGGTHLPGSGGVQGPGTHPITQQSGPKPTTPHSPHPGDHELRHTKQNEGVQGRHADRHEKDLAKGKQIDHRETHHDVKNTAAKDTTLKKPASTPKNVVSTPPPVGPGQCVQSIKGNCPTPPTATPPTISGSGGTASGFTPPDLLAATEAGLPFFSWFNQYESSEYYRRKAEIYRRFRESNIKRDECRENNYSGCSAEEAVRRRDVQSQAWKDYAPYISASELRDEVPAKHPIGEMGQVKAWALWGGLGEKIDIGAKEWAEEITGGGSKILGSTPPRNRDPVYKPN